MSPFFTLMIYPLEIVSILLLGLMVITWLLFIFQKNASLIDIACGMAIGIVAFLAFLVGDGDSTRRFLFLSLVLLWTAHLTFRRYSKYDEKLESLFYQQMRKNFGDQANIKFLFVFLFRGLLTLCCTLFFFPICFNVNPTLSLAEWVGTFTILATLLGETAIGLNLIRFKSPLAQYPHFFEWCVWVGFAIFALGSPYGWFGLLSSILMFYLLYQQTPSQFFPWPKR